MTSKLKSAWVAAAAGAVVMGAAWAQPHGSMWPGMRGDCDGYGHGYGHGAFGMGPGMMGGYGGEGMGPGPMYGGTDAPLAGLALTQEQRKKITDLRAEASQAMWELMGTMHRQGHRMRGMYGPGAYDEAAARKAYQAMSEAQQAMFEMRLDLRKKIEAVLTEEQRENLRKHWSER